MSSHSKSGKKSKSSKGDSWSGMYMERKKSDRGTIHVRRRDAAPESSQPRGRSPGAHNDRRENYQGSRHNSPPGSRYSSPSRSSYSSYSGYSSNVGRSDVSPPRSQYGNQYGNQNGNQYGNQNGNQHGGQYASQHGSHGGPNMPPAQPAMLTQPTIPEEPRDQQPTQAGYRVVEMPNPGGKPLRVSVATGYTSNRVAYQANGYSPPDGNPNVNPYQAASNAQAPGCHKDNPVNQYYRGNWF